MLRPHTILARACAPAFFLTLTTALCAQGDDCQSATAHSGNLALSFHTGAFTTSGFHGGSPCSGSPTPLHRDAFFQWTATVDGDYRIDTNGSNFDTQLSVHSGVGCAATCVGTDDDGGNGLQSAISLSGVLAGETYLIQVGGYGSNFGSAQLNVAEFVNYCAPSFEDPLEPNDYCSQARSMGNGSYLELFASKIDTDNYSICLAAGETLQVSASFVHATADIDLWLWEEASENCGLGDGLISGLLASSESSSDSEALNWTNSTGGTQTVILQVGVYSGSSGACNLYDLTVSGANTCGALQVGDSVCDPMNPNSTGQSTRLAGSIVDGIGSELHLEATAGPPGQFAYVLIGTGVHSPGLAVGQGRLCLAVTAGHQIGAYSVTGTDQNSIGMFDGAGVYQNLAGTSSVGSGFDVPVVMPMAGNPSLMDGQIWCFQLWHRDVGGTSNFSNAIPVTF